MAYCAWGLSGIDKTYHDEEWGVPVHDDRTMFEHLMLELKQCGLSWSLMLKKRAIFRACFDGFDYDKVARYTDADVERILTTEGMIRSPRKINAIIENARRYQAVRAEFGSFCDYIWSFTGGKTLLYDGHAEGHMPTRNALSELISRDLKARGFKYVGAVTIYSHLQACGMINDHGSDCPCYKRINSVADVLRLPPDGED